MVGLGALFQHRQLYGFMTLVWRLTTPQHPLPMPPFLRTHAERKGGRAALWMSSTSDRVLQEGDDDTDPLWDLLSAPLTLQVASAAPVFSNFLKEDKTFWRG